MVKKFSFLHLCPLARKEPISSLLHFLSLRLKFIVTEVWWRGLLSGYLAYYFFLFQLLLQYQQNSTILLPPAAQSASACQLSSECWVYSPMFMLLYFAALPTNISIPTDLSLLLNLKSIDSRNLAKCSQGLSLWPRFSPTSIFLLVAVYCPEYACCRGCLLSSLYSSLQFHFQNFPRQPLHLATYSYGQGQVFYIGDILWNKTCTLHSDRN